MEEIRVGLGFDVHRLAEGRPLRLGGVTIPFERGLLGHSDGDVVLHAVADALLGAAGLPDLGTLFPDTDPAWEGADSRELLRHVASKVRQAGFRPVQVDAVIIAERPRLAPYTAAMAEEIRRALQQADLAVSVRPRTAEGLGAVGRGEAMVCLATVLLARQQPHDDGTGRPPEG